VNYVFLDHAFLENLKVGKITRKPPTEEDKSWMMLIRLFFLLDLM